jgi:glycine cleavage system T protein (aminomethyltransferase)
MKKTQLASFHEDHAKMTEFAGYDMPLWYTSNSEEHLAVRNSVGAFDVSHMGRVEVKGKDAGAYLDSLLPTNVASQPAGKSFYTLLLNHDGGIIDDLVVMKMGPEEYLAVVNAVNARGDLDHMLRHATGYDVALNPMTDRSAMIAVQGPESSVCLQPVTDLDLASLKRFRCGTATVAGRRCIVSRTGYTGEDGFEVIVMDASLSDPSGAVGVWEAVLQHAKPCGLAARDSLRIEAGYPLWGLDMDEKTGPAEADLAWVVSKEKTGYVGYERVAEALASPPARIRKGVSVTEGIPRSGYDVLTPDGADAGKVTSGTYSPVLRRGIAICKIAVQHSAIGTRVEVLIRGTAAGGEVVRTPFYDETQFGWKRGKGK